MWSFAERALPIAILCVAGVCVPIEILEPEGLPRMRSLEQELHGVEKENAELRRDIDQLRAQVRDLKDDPAAVERIARDELGLVRRSEVVFHFARPPQKRAATP